MESKDLRNVGKKIIYETCHPPRQNGNSDQKRWLHQCEIIERRSIGFGEEELEDEKFFFSNHEFEVLEEKKDMCFNAVHSRKK